MRPLPEYSDYRVYLKDALAALGRKRKGVKSRLAEALACRPGYVTQVLTGAADLSPDQASLAGEFLGLTEEESDYFLLLVLSARAGTPTLRAQLNKQIRRHKDRYLNLKERMKVEQKIAPADETIFYSSWQYLAVLSLLSCPGKDTKESLAKHLNISPKRTAEILGQLQALGLVAVKGAKFTYGPSRTHLAKDSPMVSKHHINWRLQAMQAIERQSGSDFFYSSVITISEKDRDVVKALLISALEEAAKVIAPSPSEKLCSICMDFFEI
jgi:uncharacterized protein (TIGR02147 family)